MTILTRIALYKRWITFLIVALITAGAIFATIRLKMELIPDIELPMTTVLTVYPGASPEVVMEDVTVPVEATISDIPKLKHITSTSTEGMSFVYAEFEYGTDMDKVNSLISEQLSELDLPSDMPREVPQIGENPKLYPINLSMMPVVMLSLYGDIDPGKLREIAITEVMPKLNDIDGVFSVSVEGGDEKVLISPDAQEMNDNDIPMSWIVSILSTQQYASLSDIENTPVGAGIMLKDVASVDIGPAPGTALTHTNGKNSVGIVVMKDTEANTVAVANAVEDKAKEIEQSLGDNGNEVKLLTVFDQSDYIERSISTLTREAVIGAILAVIVIFLFLMTLRGSLVTAISIPLSILIGFLVMYFWGITINILTLSAMAIAVGRIVDDSIVVLEVIYRHLHQGEGFREAALNGVREVAAPVISATLATIAIFLPLAFVGGIVGELFVPFALTITFALIASLLVALMVVPPLSSVLVPKKFKVETRDTWYQRAYTPVLKWALTHRALTLVIAAVLFFGSFALLPIIGTSFMPSMGEKMLTVEVVMPLGTDMKTTAAKATQVEKLIDPEVNPSVQRYYTTIGTSSSLMGGMTAMLMGGGSNIAFIEAYLDTHANAEEERDKLEQLCKELPGEGIITVSATDSMMGGMGTGFQVSIQGDEYLNVENATYALGAVLQDVEGLVNIESDIATTLPRPNIQIDDEKAASKGMNKTVLEGEIYGAMMRGVETRASFDGKTLFVEGIMGKVGTPEELGELRVSGGLSQPTKLSEIVTTTPGFVMEPTHISRVDNYRAATITASITEKNVGAVNQAAQEKINALSPEYPDVKFKMGGVAEEMQESFRDMFIAIIIAIAIAYAVVVIFFRSFLNPLIIMVSLPLASIGALLALLVTGRTLDISALMGVLMLVGIVLSNAILLMALVEQLRKGGMSTFDALVQGGRTRLRPILMTALATMFALIPLALGLEQGVLIAASLGTVVIGGLFTSTLLTLLVIPVVYSLVEGLRRRRPTS